MPSKRRPLRYHDLPTTAKSGPSGANTVDDVAAPPAITVGAPQNVVLTTDVIYASAAPQSYIQIDWDPPETNTGQRPDRYTIQVSTNSTFTASGTITTSVAPEDPDAPVARVDGLPPNTLHYVRLRAIVNGFPGNWTSMSPLTTGVNRITTAQDLSAAAQVTGLAAVWVGTGDLLITWTNPTSTNWMNDQVMIKASSGGATLRVVDTAASSFLYTFAMNDADTSHVPDNNLYVEVRSRTFSNVLNNASVPNVTSGAKAAPATPTGLSHTWSGETDHNGTAAADWTLSWTRNDDAARYRVTIDSVAHVVAGDNYAYPFALNKSEHSGTPDAVLSYSLVALDSFGTASTAASGTATNEDPPTPSVTLTVGFSILIATLGGVRAADFKAYRYVWKRDGTSVRTQDSAASEQQYELSGAADSGYHSWTVDVIQIDLFDQVSTTTTSSAQAFEGYTIAGLRDMVEYSDSEGTAAATLKAQLADGNTTSGGITYNP